MLKEIDSQNLSKIALKNSGYNFISSLITKVGGLIFTIIIARLLLPELFGIYALILSIVAIISTFTNLGIDNTFLRYLSESLGKKEKSKSHTYFKFLLKLKSYLLIIIILVVLFSAKFISYTIYDKPLLFYPLIFSCLFIITESMNNFFGSFFAATKNLKPVPWLAFSNQITRIIFAVLAVILLQDNFKVPGILLAFGLSGFLNILIIIYISYKKNKEVYIGKSSNINKKQVLNYALSMSIVSISLVVFTSIDTLMLGKFVDAEYLGYYRAALSLVLTLSALFSVSGVLLPIFTQIHQGRFERGFQKVFRYLMIFAIPATIGIISISNYLIFVIYGNAYLPATFPLYFLALLIIIDPLISFYTILFQSKNKPNILAKGVLISLLLNIILNYILIKYLIDFSQEYVLAGVAIATVISRFLFLGIISLSAKNKFNLQLKGIGLKSQIFSVMILGIFLFVYNHFVDINLLWGISEIVLGIIIYFGTLYLIKGLTKEDFNLFKSLIKK
jgi:O-antigen/teichoic acid export membrane protein